MKRFKLRRIGKVSLYTFFANIPTYFYIILIPIIQNYLFSPDDFFEHITSYGVSLLMSAAAFAISAADYSKRRYRLSDSRCTVRQGLFVRSIYSVPYEKLHTVTLVTSPTLRLFSAQKLILSATRSGKRRGSLYIPKKSADKFEEGIRSSLGSRKFTISTTGGRAFLSAALLSNPISGLLAAVPIIRSAGRVVGENTSTELLRTLDFSGWLVVLGLPPAAAFTAYFLLVFYAVGALELFFKTAGLSCDLFENGTVITSGIKSRREVFVPYHRIDSVVITRSVFMLPFSRCSVFVSSLGAGKKGLRLCCAVEKTEPAYSAALRFFGKCLPNGVCADDLCRAFSESKNSRRDRMKAAAAPAAALALSAALCAASAFTRVFGCAVPLALCVLVVMSALWLAFRLYVSGKVGSFIIAGLLVTRKYKRLTLVEEIVPMRAQAIARL